MVIKNKRCSTLLHHSGKGYKTLNKLIITIFWLGFNISIENSDTLKIPRTNYQIQILDQSFNQFPFPFDKFLLLQYLVFIKSHHQIFNQIGLNISVCCPPLKFG